MDRQRSSSGSAQDSVSLAVERVRALLVLQRVSDAMTIATDLVAQFPGSSATHVLQGDCLLAAGRVREAEHSATQATTLAPDDPECAILAVRCAIDTDKDALWARVQRLQELDAITYRSRYWTVIGTASAGREALAFDLLRRLESEFAGSLEPRYAAAEVDLIVAAQHRFRRPHIAAAIAVELLAHDPLDQRAHRLRRRAAGVRPAGSSTRWAAEELTHVRQATAAGVLPPPTYVKGLTVKAVGPLGLGLVGLACTLALAAAVDGGLAWYIGVLVATAAWSLACVVVFHRIAAVSMLLPELGRARLLRPVTRSLTVTAVVLAVCAIAALVTMFPYDVERATSLGFSNTPAHSETRVDYGNVGTGSSTIRVPRIITISVPEVADPEGAIRLLRYYTGMGVVALAMASALLVRSRTTRRRRPE